jgi:hypothetical protein
MYAVCQWFNYRKDLSAGFIQDFDDYQEAKRFAYNKALKDYYRYNTPEEGERPYKV